MKFYIKQKVFSFRDKFTVKDLEQNDLYQVKGKLMSISNKIDFMDMNALKRTGEFSKQSAFRVFWRNDWIFQTPIYG